MKKLALVTTAIITMLSASGCAGIGKGKAPPLLVEPPPIISKG